MTRNTKQNKNKQVSIYVPKRNGQVLEKIPVSQDQPSFKNGYNSIGRPTKNRPRNNRRKTRQPRQLPQFVAAQLDAFDRVAFGVKVPDESSAPSAVGFSRNLGPISPPSSGVSCVVYRYHPQSYEVTSIPNGALPAWTWGSSYAGNIPVVNASALDLAYGAMRTVAFGIKISTRQAYTAASGFIHVALVPDIIDGTTWSYPLTIPAMEFAPVYKRIPVADLVENQVIVMSKFTDATAFRYYDPAHFDFSLTTTAGPVSTSGWMAIQVCYEGVAALTNAVDVEYIAHYEAFTNATAGTGIIEVTRAAPHSPATMAACSYVTETTQQIRTVSDNQLDETSTWDDAVDAFRTGLQIANGIVSVTNRLSSIIL